MNKVLVGVVWFVVASGIVHGAGADVIGPPPTDCVPGTLPRSSHGAAYCVPWTCVTGAGCPAGVACRSQPFCVVGSGTSPAVQGYCDANGHCATGTCEAFQVCIAGASGVGGASAAGGSSGRGQAGAQTAGSAGKGAADPGDEWLSGRACTCRTPAANASGGGLILALAVGLGSVLRRCRRNRCRA
jgi:hypothetical protein